MCFDCSTSGVSKNRVSYNPPLPYYIINSLKYFVMAVSRFFPTRRRDFRPYSSSSSFAKPRASSSTGTRFQARKFTNRVTGREVPYYLGPGREAHVFDSPIHYSFTTATSGGNSHSTTSAALHSLLNPITRGTGIFDRESQRASMKYVLFRLRCSLNAPDNTVDPGVFDPAFQLQTTPVTIRIMLLYSSTTIASIAPADFLVTPGATMFNDHWASSAVQRIDSREQHQILYDNKFVLRNTNANYPSSPPPSSYGSTPSSVSGDFTFKDLDIRIPISRPVAFTASSTSPITLSDITSGALHLMVLVDGLYSGPLQRVDCTVLGSSRLVFSP